MNFKIRKVKTASGKFAVQVFEIVNRKRNILKHIGSGSNDIEIGKLTEIAGKWIINQQSKFGLFRIDAEEKFLNNYEYQNTKNIYAYEYLSSLWNKWNLNTKLIFKDLCILQILEPGSKRHHIEFLENNLEIKYNLNNTISN